MYRPISLRSIKTGATLGGGEDSPHPLESIGKQEPISTVATQLRPSDGSKIELHCPDLPTLWRFLSENNYEDMFRLPVGNRIGLTGVSAEQFATSGDWVISATAWPMEPLYVSAPTVSFPTSRVVTGFERSTEEAGSQDSLPQAPKGNGEYALVATMGNRGVGSGAHWHLDEFASPDSVAWGAQISPRGAPGRPADNPFRVGSSSTYSAANTYPFGQAPDTIITSGYGATRGRKSAHRGVDVVNNTNRYLFAPSGSFVSFVGGGRYGTYIVCGRFGIGHADLNPPTGTGGSIASRPPLQAAAFSPDSLGLASLPLIGEPLDGLPEGRFSLPRNGFLA